MRILFLSRWYPFPPDNGSKIRISNLLRYLSEQNEIDLISFSSEDISADRILVAKKYCQNVTVINYRDFNPYHWKALSGFFSKKPRSMVYTHNAAMQQCVENALDNNHYEVVVASQLDMLPYIEKVKGPSKFLEELELTPFYEQIEKERTSLGKLRRELAWKKLISYIEAATKDFLGVTVVSEKEKTIVVRSLPQLQNVKVVPNTVDFEENAAYRDTKKTVFPSLIFNGALSFYVNLDAMKYFIHDVFPVIQKKIPDVKLFITGSLSGVDVSEFAENDGVIFTGYLKDIQKAVAESWVCIVPIRLGGGTRLKILEALSLHTPVVATSKGAEGLDLISGQDFLAGDSPGEFAEQVVKLIQDKDIRNELSEAGYASGKERYDWRFAGGLLEDFICRTSGTN